jgi:hypothetical protein
MLDDNQPPTYFPRRTLPYHQTRATARLCGQLRFRDEWLASGHLGTASVP